MDRILINEHVVKAARRLLAEHHPISIADLAELLAKEGMTAAEGQDPLRWVGKHLSAASTGRSVSWELPDRRLVDIDRLYEGLVLTHRVTGSEVARGVIEVEPDLIPLLLIDCLDDPEDDDAYIVLADGGRAVLAPCFPPGDELGLSGPPGWLGEAAEGDVLAFRVSDAQLTVSRVEKDPRLASETVQALQSAYAKVCRIEAEQGGERDEPVQILDVFMVALAENQGLFREPLPPLRWLLLAGRLDASGKTVHELAFPLPDPGESDSVPAVDEVSAVALQILLAVGRLTPSEVLGELGLSCRTLARLLSRPGVATAFAVQTVLLHVEDEVGVGGFARALVGDHAWNAGPNLVLALCAEMRGDIPTAEAYVAEALRADPYHRESLVQAAWYAEDRGDAAGALQYLRQSGVEADPQQILRLEHFAAPGPAAAARGEPCPCGSGRTHGLCCAHRNGHPLHQRAGWLMSKALRYVSWPPSLLAIRPIAEARACKDPKPLAWERAALTDLFVQDLGLFEGGLLEEFLDVRGVLLPADELALGRSWLGTRRSLYEITHVDADDRRLGIHDLVTGERLEVPEDPGVGHLDAALLIYARVVPDGRGQRLAGPLVPIPLEQRQSLLELLGRNPGPVEIAAWLAGWHDGPSSLTGSGIGRN